jgi:hypothetical protein
MSDPYSPFLMRQTFAAGARVSVSAICGGWRNDATGVIVGAPEPIETVQGEDYFYWVLFDVPQHDLSDDGPYYKAQILSRCITNAV